MKITKPNFNFSIPIKEARKLTQNEVDKIRDALDIIQNIRQLREEKRVLENKPRSTRRGVLMNQLQTLGKLGLEFNFSILKFYQKKEQMKNFKK